MAHGGAREVKWRGNWRIEWVASTLRTTSGHGVTNITTADAHASAASSRLNWRPHRLRADSHYASRFRSVTVPSEWSVFTLSVVFSRLPEQHVIGGLRLFPLNMRPHSFSKRHLAATALMLVAEEKYAALSDKKKRMWVHNCFRSRKSEGDYWTL